MHLFRPLACVLIALFGLPGLVMAQQSIKINGYIFRKGSDGRISQAVITDLNNKNVMMSDDLGMFSISAAIGDTLQISKKEYATFKVTVDSKADLMIGMQPLIALKEVTITGQTKKQELNDVMKQYKSQGIYNQGKSLPVWQFINSPLTGFYNIFGKGPRDERRFAAYAETELENTAIDKRYTKELVKSITKLPDEEVTKFMLLYTPSYQDMKEWNDYQLITYIKKNLVFYKRNMNRAQQLQLPPSSKADQKVQEN